MAALMKLRVIHVFTHDSHRPGRGRPDPPAGRARAGLRLIPHLDVWRPADTSRPRWPGPARSSAATARRAAAVAPERCRWCADAGAGRGRSRRGGYVLADAPAARRARGDHRHRLRGAARAAGADSCWRPKASPVRVVSMPCTTSSTGRTPPTATRCCRPALPRVAVEAGVTRLLAQVRRPRRRAWSASTSFGESAPAGDLFKHFGITAEHVAAEVRRCCAR